MRFTIATQELNYLISKCHHLVGQKAAVPILANILVEAINDELILTATDLTVGIRCFTEAKIQEEGATTLPAKHFAQLIRELTSANVEVFTNPQEITEITANSSKFKLHGMNKSEFPALPDIAEATQFKIKQGDLKDALYRTAFAVSREDTRYVLTGIHMQIVNGEAVFIGTDGKRLAKVHFPIPIDQAFTGHYIIPIKAVEEFLKNLSEEGEATLFLMDDKIAMEASNTTIITKLLSGEYPDANRVIPEHFESVITLHREELVSLLRQIALFTENAEHPVRFIIEEGELKLSANAMEVGEGKVSMPVNYAGQKIEIAFNPMYFLDILRHCKNETIALGIIDAYNPGAITDNETLSITSSPLFILMPMRFREE